MSDKRKHELRQLMAKMRIHFPEKSRSEEYLTNWCQQIPPPAGVQKLDFLDHDYTVADDAGLSVPFADVLNRACRDDGVRQVFLVKRRQAGRQRAVCNPGMPLLAYMNFRRLQGVSEFDAVQEWNGAQAAG